jgi:hypothetical protein
MDQLESNLGSLDVAIPDGDLGELDTLTEPERNFPYDILETVAIPWQQGGTTINGLTSTAYRRD